MGVVLINFITCRDLIKVFPQYKERIEYTSGHYACGCAGCVSNALQKKIGFNLLAELLKKPEYKGRVASSLVA